MVAGTPKRDSIVIERGAILLHQLLPLLGQPRDACLLDVVGRHLHELGLRRRTGRGTAGQDQIGQLVVGLQPARLGIERRARNAGRLRFRPQRGDELREGGVGGVRGTLKTASRSNECTLPSDGKIGRLSFHRHDENPRKAEQHLAVGLRQIGGRDARGVFGEILLALGRLQQFQERPQAGALDPLHDRVASASG